MPTPRCNIPICRASIQFKYQTRRSVTWLDLSVARIGRHRFLGIGCRSGTGGSCATELAQHRRIALTQRTRAAENVCLAATSQGALAGRCGGRRGEHGKLRLQVFRLHDILKDGTFHQSIGGFALKGMVGVCIPVVVDGVDDGSVVDLGRAAGGVADVVALNRDLVVLASEVKSLCYKSALSTIVIVDH